MTAVELREMSVEDLRAKLRDLSEESFNLRFQHSLGQLSSPIRLRQVRREVARVRTVVRERSAMDAPESNTVEAGGQVEA